MPELLIQVKGRNSSEVRSALGFTRQEQSFDVPEIQGGVAVVPMKGFQPADFLEFVLTFSAGVASSVVGNWLYQRITGLSASVTINRKEVDFEKGKIARFIEEEIKLQK